jgi:SAM-dependent methyltransferase
VKTIAIAGLRRLGLLRPAYGVYQLARGSRGALADRAATPAPDGLPLPPARLRNLVGRRPDAGWYLQVGGSVAETIREALVLAGSSVERCEAILDFGCGCGRVTRRWKDLPARIHGTDVHARSIEWCRRNLPFATFSVNGAFPPLPHESEAFDLVYAISVFTHMPEPQLLAWATELRRVVRPGGHLLFTTLGREHGELLSPEERGRLAAGELVVRHEEAFGTNLCLGYQPREYVERRLADGLRPAAFLPGRAFGQDVYLFEKPAV